MTKIIAVKLTEEDERRVNGVPHPVYSALDAGAYRPQQKCRQMRVIGRPEPRRQREADSEPGDHSHLPAFLLRPVRSPAGA